jgi:oligoribonuclease NrnB/cAMP/cGMP phosphodiesterase (DHH superfamily)
MSNMKEAILQTAKTFEQALDGISKVAIVFDDDPDGISAAALLSKFLKSKNITVTGLSLTKYSILSDQFKKKTEDVECIIFADVCLFNSCNIAEFTTWCEKNKKSSITFDHHKSSNEPKDVSYPGTYFNSGDLQDIVPANRYCTSKLVFDVLLTLDPEIKKFAWLACIGVLGDYAHDTWKKIIQFAISFENQNMEDTDTEYLIPKNQDEFRGSIFGKVSDLTYFGASKGESMTIYHTFVNSEKFKEVITFLQQYKPIGEEIQDYVENLKYMIKNTPHKNKGELQVFEVEVKSQHNILIPVMNHMAEEQADVLIIGYAVKGTVAKVLTRLANKTLDLPSIFKQAAKGNTAIQIGGSPVGAIATMPKELLKTFKNAIYEVLETNE